MCSGAPSLTSAFVLWRTADFKDAFGTSRVFNENDFGSSTLESIDLESENGMRIYQEAKILADKAIWEIAHEHPDVDFTVCKLSENLTLCSKISNIIYIVLPPGIFGPQITPLTSSPSSLGTNSLIKMLFAAEYPPIPVGHMIDVRDAALAHVLALDTPPVLGRDKRFIILNNSFTWQDVAALIRRKKPELADRLPKEGAASVAQISAPVDTTFTKDILGLTTYISSEETFLTTVDVVLEWEKRFDDKSWMEP